MQRLNSQPGSSKLGGAALLTARPEEAEGPGGPRSHTHGRWSMPGRLHRPLGTASEGSIVEGHG